MTAVEPTVRRWGNPNQRTARLSSSAINSIMAEGRLLSRLHEAIEGKYQLRGALGQGGMGTVYLAQDLALARPVAIKVMLPGLAPDPDTVERFRREARTIASLSHPNIVPVYAVHESENLAYFVMRYVKGCALDSVVHRHGPLPLEVARSILRQVGSGLQYAHRRGVIHRDIKPANIMIDEDGWALIADFGIAKVRGAHAITRSGTTIGTPAYMSPEQCCDLEITAASDQYALGMVAYELLTGRPPFQAETFAAVVKKQVFDTPPPLEELLPECPPDTARAIGRMVAKSAGLRWRSVEEAVRQIGGRLDADSELSRKQIVSVAQHGEEIPITWLDPNTLEPTTPLVLETRRVDSAARRRSSWLFRIGGGTVGAAMLVSLTLVLLGDQIGAASVTDTTTAVRTEASLQPDDEPAAEASQPATAPVSSADPRTTADPAEAHPPGEAGKPAEIPAVAQVGPRGSLAETARKDGSGGDSSTALSKPAVTGVGSVLLGTRGRPAVLYVNGAAQGAASRLISWQVPAAEVTLSIRMEGCTSWDSTVFVRPDEQLRIGYRNPVCGG